MKIQNINNNYMGYKGAKPVKKEEIHEAGKYDTIEIKNKNKDRSDINSIKKNIVSEIKEETSAEKINKIKDSINNKTYSIDVEEIVKRLLK